MGGELWFMNSEIWNVILDFEKTKGEFFIQERNPGNGEPKVR